jgi:D-glycero-alpha-D-manno-heptose-7-phosphate kinase
VIGVSVPVRICDNGGWTDTWFGGPGHVLNIAVKPGVDVTLGATEELDHVRVDVKGDDRPYAVTPGAPRVARHPLVEAAIDLLPPPEGVGLELIVRSAVPAGCGAGTSAAVAVALLSGLSAVRSERRSPRDVAYLAHRLEVDVLGLQSGIQDQLSAAFGGINYLEVDPYPEATVQNLGTWTELDARLTLVHLGRGHDSSRMHRQVIEHLERHASSAALTRLRGAAVAARDAVIARDLPAFGQAMINNTDAQSSLHPAIVGVDATRVIECAARYGALGWKVNGAGGDGGSVTILNATGESKHTLEHRVTRLDQRYRVLPTQIASVGLEVKGGLDTSGTQQQRDGLA